MLVAELLSRFAMNVILKRGKKGKKSSDQTTTPSVFSARSTKN